MKFQSPWCNCTGWLGIKHPISCEVSALGLLSVAFNSCFSSQFFSGTLTISVFLCTCVCSHQQKLLLFLSSSVHHRTIFMLQYQCSDVIPFCKQDLILPHCIGSFRSKGRLYTHTVWAVVIFFFFYSLVKRNQEWQAQGNIL